MAPPFVASMPLAAAAVLATDRAPAAVPAPASAPGDSSAGGGGNSALAAVAANCSHIRADAALRNARASLAKAGALPLGDSWCAASDRVSLSSPARIELALNVSGGTALMLKVGPDALACRSSCNAAQQPEHHYVLDALLSAARMLAGVTG
jgi:hypothetical protein